LQNQQQLNSSSEALPPPPEYLLQRTQQQQQLQMQQQHHPHIANHKPHYLTSSTSVGQISTSVSGQNVKVLNDVRNAPNSPGVMRRQLSLTNHHPSSNHSQPTHNVIIFSFSSFIFFKFNYHFPTSCLFNLIPKFTSFMLSNTLRNILTLLTEKNM
jgi:hypothetical protein